MHVGPEFDVDPKGDEEINRAFVDPTGCHVLISMTNGDNYYLNTQNNKNPKVQPRLKGLMIESVAWNVVGGTKDATESVLLGTNDSCIYEVRLEDGKEPVRHLKLLFDFRDRTDVLVQPGPITGLRMECFPRERGSKEQSTTYLVIASTPFSLFQFIGGPSLEDMFETYRKKNLLVFQELPFSAKRSGIAGSELHLHVKNDGSRVRRPADSFSWLSMSGIYHGTLNYDGSRAAGSSCIGESEIIQFDSKHSSALSMAITDYHTVVLFPDKLQILMQPSDLVMGGNNQSGVDEFGGSVPQELSTLPFDSIRIVQEETFPSSKGALIGLSQDTNTDEVYVYTDSAVWRLIVDQEDRDVWRLYLEKATDPRTSKDEYFSIAQEICDHDPRKKDIVLIAKADYLFKTKQYEKAANVYARTTKSFEEVAISFHNKGQRDALRRYLLNMLKLTIAEGDLNADHSISQSSNNKPRSTQLTVLCIWLTELYLDKINQLYDLEQQQQYQNGGNVGEARRGDDYKERASLKKTREEFRQFLENHKVHLGVDKDTVFNLIASHGQVDELIYFAMLMEDYERVISHYITENNFKLALEILSKFCKSRQYEEHFYKFAPLLMQHLPKETVAVLTMKKFLDPGRLIPALMRYIVVFDPKASQENYVIRYLEWCIGERHNEDPAIHNLLLSLYAKQGNERKLLRFLNTEGEHNFYDPKYALRVCRDADQTEACVLLYSMMSMYEDAVDLALQTNEIQLARECADKPDDDELKKKLWLRIAKHVIEKDNDVKKAIEFLGHTDKIKLEDVLPFFPDFVLIDDFKDEICKSLQEYKAEIEELKEEMHEATQNANLIRDDIKDLKHRYGYISANAKCNAAGCFQNVLTQSFYMFPCNHIFHTECLIREVKQHVSETARAHIDELYTKSQRASEQLQRTAAATADSSGGGYNVDTAAALTDEIKQLDEMIASECPLCGNMIIETIDEKFVSASSEELDWKI